MPEPRLSELAAVMRGSGARIGVGELLAAHRALAAVDPTSREDVYFALRAALCSTRAELDLFAQAFAAVFATHPDERENPLHELGEIQRAALPRVGVPLEAAGPPEAIDVPAPAAYSEQELLRVKDFGEYTDAERAVARRLLGRIAARAPQRLSRRTRPTRRRREAHDLRATVRASLRHGGELMERRYREPALRPRRVVLVCDVSGSMAPYARMLLQYLQASVAAHARVEAFVFGTRLTRVTRELEGRDPDRALQRAAERVTDWSGGTRIGAALAELNREHGRRIGRG
ncbi:MAG: vWA domain-containing protein, partial [Solirubrobacteraceae bacterium]